MLLIYIKRETSRISYIFKHICVRILGFDISFTTSLEEFIAHSGPKISYGKKPLGNELFFQSSGLLEQQGIESVDLLVKKWDDTVGFFPVSDNSCLPFDIFSASFYLLTRYEEYLPQVRDSLGRFLATESLAYQENFLHQPVVDIWAYKFKEKLVQAFPQLVFEPRTMTIHPLIEASVPYAYKNKGFYRTLVGYGSDLVTWRFSRVLERTKVLLGIKRDPKDGFKWLINIAKHSDFKMTFFFLLGDAMSFSDSVNTYRQKFKLLLKYVADYEEVGLIFSHEALSDMELLKTEKQRLEEITNRSVAHSMNIASWLKLPDMYRNLIELEVENDYTMAFCDKAGFRAGTCTPFLFYDVDYEIKTPLVIHPLVLTTQAVKQRYSSDLQHTIDRLLEEVQRVNGHFIIQFSNTDFAQTPQNQIWRKLLSEKLSKHEN